MNTKLIKDVQIGYSGTFYHPYDETSTFILDNDSMDMIVSETKDRDVNVDIDHSLLSEWGGQSIGTIKRDTIRREKDILLCDMEVQSYVFEDIRDGNFSFTSPVFQIDKKDVHSNDIIPLWLHSVALTNTPRMNKNKAIYIANKEGYEDMKDKDGKNLVRIFTSMIPNSETGIDESKVTEFKAELETAEKESEELKAENSDLKTKNAELEEKLKVQGKLVENSEGEAKTIIALSEKVVSMEAQLKGVFIANSETSFKNDMGSLGVKPAFIEQLKTIKNTSEDAYQIMIKKLPKEWIMPESEKFVRNSETNELGSLREANEAKLLKFSESDEIKNLPVNARYLKIFAKKRELGL